MPRIEQPVVEAQESECIYCGIDLIARLTDYKGKFPDYLQWQSTIDRKSHYMKDGGCKSQDKSKASKESPQIPQTNSSDEDMRYVRNKIDLMFAMIAEQFRDYTDRKSQT